jgi:DNA mismatch endonuclease (patch repair protein)
MADNLSHEQRHRNMSNIRSVNTRPEMVVRSLAHALGFRFRLHARNLPGRPDLVFSSRNKVILVHGCFWHMHSCRSGRVVPRTNIEYWHSKRSTNVKRDKINLKALKKQGWQIMVVWECETIGNVVDLGRRIESFLRKHG